MAGLRAGRASCAALPAPAIPRFGVSALLRSVHQLVADRRGRRPGRAGSRPGLRTLVVGGIAGAAWLLSAAAAHAAEPETPTDAAYGGLGVHSLVSDLGTEVVEKSAPSLIGELLTPAAEVTAALPLNHLHGTGDPARNDSAMPARQPVEADAPAPSRTDIREPAAPLRPTGGPIGSMNTAAASTTPTRATASADVTTTRLGSEPGRAARPVPAEPSPLVDALTGVPGQSSGALPTSVVGAAPGVLTGGSFSAVVVGTTGAESRPAAPADVVVPRCDAEAPTVSPD